MHESISIAGISSLARDALFAILLKTEDKKIARYDWKRGEIEAFEIRNRFAFCKRLKHSVL
jgi:hypothetical protein